MGKKHQSKYNVKCRDSALFSYNSLEKTGLNQEIGVYNFQFYYSNIQCFFHFWSVSVNVIFLFFSDRLSCTEWKSVSVNVIFLFVSDRLSCTEWKLQTAHKRSWNVHRSVHANGQERLETFESGSSNALERIVENVHVHASKKKETV